MSDVNLDLVDALMAPLKWFGLFKELDEAQEEQEEFGCDLPAQCFACGAPMGETAKCDYCRTTQKGDE